METIITEKIAKSVVRKVKSTRFGEIRFNERDIILFPKGLLGFESLHEYVLIERESTMPFLWLQSVKNPSIAFPIVDPLYFKPDYEVRVHAGDLAGIGTVNPSNARIFVVVTIPPKEPEEISINLLGPIIVNLENKKAVQIPLTDSDYSTKYYLFRDNPAEITKDEIEENETQLIGTI